MPRRRFGMLFSSSKRASILPGSAVFDGPEVKSKSTRTSSRHEHHTNLCVKQHRFAFLPSAETTKALESLGRCLSIWPRMILFRVEELNLPPPTQMTPRARSSPSLPFLCASRERSSDSDLPCEFRQPLSTNSEAVVPFRLHRSARHDNPAPSTIPGPCAATPPQATTRKRLPP